MRVNIGAPGAGVGHANGRMLGNLADDAETEVDLPLEVGAFDRGELAAFAHLDTSNTVAVTEEVRVAKVGLDGDRHRAHGERHGGTGTDRCDLDVVLHAFGLEVVVKSAVNDVIGLNAGPSEADVRGDLGDAEVEVVRTFNKALKDGSVFAVARRNAAEVARGITIFVSVGNAVGHRDVADVGQAVDAEVLVFTVDLALSAAVVGVAVAEEGTELRSLADVEFSTDHADREVDVEAVGIAVGLTPATHTSSPDMSTTFVELSAAAFTHAGGLIDDGARYLRGVRHEGVAGGDIEVIVERGVDILELALVGRSEKLTHQGVAGSSDGTGDAVLVGAVGEGLERDAFITLHRNFDLLLVGRKRGAVDRKEEGVDEVFALLKIGLFKCESGVRREGTGNGRTFAVVNLNQLVMISAGKTEFDVLGAFKRNALNLDVRSAVDVKRTAVLDDDVQLVFVLVLAVQQTLLRERIVVGGQHTERALVANSNRMVGTDGLREGEKRAAGNSRLAVVIVVARQDERTFAALRERTVVEATIDLINDGFGTLRVVLKTPLLCIFKRDVLVLDTSEVIVMFLAILIGFASAGICEFIVGRIVRNIELKFREVNPFGAIKLELIGILQCRLQPGDIFTLTLFESNLGVLFDQTSV